MLLKAILDGHLGDTKQLWQDETLTSLDRAKALYYSFFWQREAMSLWLHARSDVIATTGEALLRHTKGSGYKPYWELLISERTAAGPDKKLQKISLSAAVLRAAIGARVPCRMHNDIYMATNTFERLFDAGGPGLVLQALHAGYALEAPESVWLEDPHNRSRLDKVLIAGLAKRGFPAYRIAEMKMFHAVHAEDIESLSSAIDDALQLQLLWHQERHSRVGHMSVLKSVLRAGWVEGARILVNRLNLCVRKTPLQSVSVLEAAVEEASLGCLHLLLDLGRERQRQAFVVAFRSCLFTALEQVVERGFAWCTGPPGTLLAHLPSESGLNFPTGSCLAPSHALPTQQITVEEQLTACVLALVHAARAGPGPFALEIRCWRQPEQPAFLLLQWWRRESHAHSLRPGGTASTHLPDILAIIMKQAGIVRPRDLQRAVGVAIKIIKHMEIDIAFPTQTWEGFRCN